MQQAEVYSRFTATLKDGRQINYKIQEIQDEEIDEIVDFLKKEYVHEEAFLKASGVGRNERSVKEFYVNRKNILLSQKIKGLICYEDNGEDLEIIGCNILKEVRRNNSCGLPNFTEKETIAFNRIISATLKAFDVFEKYNVDIYLSGIGLSVAEHYRGCGIATELLRTRAMPYATLLTTVKENNVKNAQNLRLSITTKLNKVRVFAFPSLEKTGKERESCSTGRIGHTRNGFSRKPLMDRHGIKLTSAWLTSPASQWSAQKLGYQCVAELTAEELGEKAGVTFVGAPEVFRLMVLTSRHY